jgi:hypothetical protein
MKRIEPIKSEDVKDIIRALNELVENNNEEIDAWNNNFGG